MPYEKACKGKFIKYFMGRIKIVEFYNVFIFP